MTSRTVVGTWLAPDAATPQSGQVLFQPSHRLTRTVAPRAILPQRPLIVALDEDGAISVDLPCTDDPELQPSGWVWTVTERIHGAPDVEWSFDLPDAVDDLDLATLEH